MQLHGGLAFLFPSIPLQVLPLAVGMKAAQECVLVSAVIVRVLELVLIIVPSHHVHICWERTEDMKHLLSNDWSQLFTSDLSCPQESVAKASQVMIRCAQFCLEVNQLLKL